MPTYSDAIQDLFCEDVFSFGYATKDKELAEVVDVFAAWLEDCHAAHRRALAEANADAEGRVEWDLSAG